MSVNPSFRLVAVLLAAGLLLAAVVLFLFYALSDANSRSSTFTFTAWFSGLQVILLLASLLYTAIKDGCPGVVVPVNSARVVVAFYYNVLAVGTIIVFTQLLLPRHATPKAYYAVCIAELGVAIVVAILLETVGISHQVGHAGAAAARGRVDELLTKCDLISANAASNGWKLDMRPFSDRIRFSEGLRRNPTLVADVTVRLSELESLTNSSVQDPAQREVRRVMAEIESLASRRA